MIYTVLTQKLAGTPGEQKQIFYEPQSWCWYLLQRNIVQQFGAEVSIHILLIRSWTQPPIALVVALATHSYLIYMLANIAPPKLWQDAIALKIAQRAMDENNLLHARLKIVLIGANKQQILPTLPTSRRKHPHLQFLLTCHNWFCNILLQQPFMHSCPVLPASANLRWTAAYQGQQLCPHRVAAALG